MEKVIANLQKLGLTEYEAKAYLALVQVGTTDAKSISKKSGVPYSTIHHVLNSLETKDWIQISKTRPTQYFTKDPKLVVEKAVQRQKEDLNEIKRTLNGELQEMYRRSPRVQSQSFWFLKDKEMTLEKIRERAVYAKKEIMVMYETYPNKLILEELSKVLPRSVPIYFIFQDNVPESIIEFLCKEFPNSHGIRFERNENMNPELVVMIDHREHIILEGTQNRLFGIWYTIPEDEEHEKEYFNAILENLW